jgi:chorismate--pyruvate lyase
VRDWLDEPGSLTRRLRAQAGAAFRVQVLHEYWGRPWPDERRRLGVPSSAWLWIREVRLGAGDRPWIHARSVIPRDSLEGPLRRLRRLGRQPLGALLFGRYPVVRGAIEVAPVDGASRLGARARSPGAEPRWARRSVFTIAGRPLLVTEVFLQPLIEELHA